MPCIFRRGFWVGPGFYGHLCWFAHFGVCNRTSSSKWAVKGCGPLGGRACLRSLPGTCGWGREKTYNVSGAFEPTP